MNAPRFPIAILWCAAAGAASAQIYGGTDAQGSILLSNFASEEASTLVVRGEPAPVPETAPRLADPEPRAWAHVPTTLEAPIRAAARRHDLPAHLIAAVIAVESNFDARAVSPKGAKGLMQLMPQTARRFGVRDVFAPHENIDAGAAYLSELLRLFGDELPLALAAYNAGEGAVMKAGRRIPAYRETQEYVNKVLARVGAAWPATKPVR
jgi:soluble lytic murein transglycosylase-like protein